MKPCRFHALAALLVALACCVPFAAARADTLQEAQRLLAQGQYQQALERTEQILTSKPKDAQARFLKGLILTEMNRQDDAIAVFAKLTEDYPELPEPYNNLAVIYAQQRQYEKAKATLEMAIRAHPGYATAYENLADIYARLAAQAYDKALQLEPTNRTAQTKLAKIRELMALSARPGASTNAPLPAAPPVAGAPAPASKAGTDSPGQAASKVGPDTAADSPPGAGGKEIAKAIQDWAAAWSRKDIEAYLGFYAEDFRTPGGEPRSAWEKARRRRIGKEAGKIEVQVENLHVSLENPQRAVARFRQHYRVAGSRTSSSKIMELVKRDGRWLIQQERVGD
jgi:tetratricopeptide (TPR) repeat protein